MALTGGVLSLPGSISPRGAPNIHPVKVCCKLPSFDGDASLGSAGFRCGVSDSAVLFLALCPYMNYDILDVLQVPR